MTNKQTLKNYFLIISVHFLLYNFTASAQEPALTVIKTDHSETAWFKELQKEEVDFNLVQKLYTEFFELHPNEKSVQRNIAIRWFMVNTNNVNALGKVRNENVPANETENLMRLNTVKKNSENKLRPSASPTTWNDMSGSWRMIGPFHNKVVPCGNGYAMSGGFIDRVYINPYNTQNLFAGQSYGGLWVSKDQGGTWKLTDAEFPNGKNTYANRDVYYGEIEVSKTNPNLVFAATEAGLLKSTNGGDSWNLVDSLNYIKKGNERSYFVALSNHDPNLLLASYGRKVYRSTNGGTSWHLVFDNSAGGNNYTQGQHVTNGIFNRKYNFAGLSFHPTANNIVYLASRNANQVLEIQISRDFGQTFKKLVSTNRTQTLKMEVVPSAPNRIYVFELFTDLSKTPFQPGIVKYDTSGVKVKEIKYPVVDHLLDDCTISETDSSIIYFGGYASGEVHKSIDGGLTFTTNNPGYKNCSPGKYIHPDIRGIHAVGDLVMVASDGGTSLSTNGLNTVYDIGKWISGIDLWGFSSAFKGDVLGSGDDHGPTEMRWFDGEGGWEHTGGADSKDITINPAQPKWIYAMDVYRKFKMTTNEASYGPQEAILDASSLKYLAIHPSIYGKSFPFKNNMLMVSTDNMATAADTLFTFSENISKVKIPLKNANTILVLVNKKSVFKSVNAGLTFTDITPNTTVSLGKTNISDIDVSSDGQEIWLSYGEVQSACKAVKSSNGGSSWVNYTTGLPSATASNITQQRGTNGAVYISTNGGGVWFRDNSMSSWSLLGNGLPMLGYVTSSYVVPDKKAFRMGTGRGAFEHELAFNTSSDAQIAVDYNTKTSCNRDTVYFRDYSAYQGTSNIQFQWTFEGGTPATSTQMNPKVLYANPGIYDVSLTVTDANGVVSNHTLTDFMTISHLNCSIDTLRGKAMVSTGQSQFVYSKSSLPVTNSYTVMAWVKGSQKQKNYAGILTLKTSTGNVHLNVRDVGDSTQIGYHHPNGEWWWSSGHFLKQNVWTHLALIVEPTKISILKDGIRASHTGKTVTNATFIDFGIGTMFGAESFRNFLGEIDEVAVYKRALTDDDVRKMMHLTKNNPKYPSQFDPDLTNYYQFNENAFTPFGVLDHIGFKDAKPNANVGLTTSTAPISSGVFEHINTALNSGVNNFNSVGLLLKVPASGTKPSFPLTIYRLDEKPHLAGDSTYKNYWLWRNWVPNKMFSNLDSIGFSNLELKPTDLVNPGNFKLNYRAVVSYENTWDFSALPAHDSAPHSLGFKNPLIGKFGQLILTRKPMPCGNALVLNNFSSKNKEAIQSTKTIELNSNSKINQNSNVVVSAANSILLLPSFETKANANFKIEIKACDEE